MLRLPYIKTNALYVLTKTYTNEIQAVQNIATVLASRYPTECAGPFSYRSGPANLYKIISSRK